MSLTVTPSASRAHSNTVSPNDSPALMTEGSETWSRLRGWGPAFIIILSAVGKRKLLRTPYFCITQNDFYGSKRPRYPSTGVPWYSDGSNASIRPPVQAQPAGDQNTSPACGKRSCECSNPGRLPRSTRCGISAPLGGPVVPLV